MSRGRDPAVPTPPEKEHTMIRPALAAAAIAAPLGRFTRGVAENECNAPHDPEDHEMRSIVLEVRVKLRAKQQRDEPDEWQCCHEERRGDTGHWSRMSLEQLRALGFGP